MSRISMAVSVILMILDGLASAQRAFTSWRAWFPL